MIQLIEANWPILLIALAIGIAVAWFAFVATRKTSVLTDRTDVLDEGAERAQRNQALIDAPTRAVPPATPDPAPPSPTMAAPDVVPISAVGAAVVAMTPSPAAAEPVAVAPSGSPTVPDDLTRIKGLGPKLAAQLGELGVTSLSQIAAWTDADIARIDPQLGRFAGRIERDQWVEQARLLASGDEAGYADRFGNTA